eukprot:gene5025-378_t
MDKALRELARYARANRMAPEPAETQLMTSGSSKQMKLLRELA